MKCVVILGPIYLSRFAMSNTKIQLSLGRCYQILGGTPARSALKSLLNSAYVLPPPRHHHHHRTKTLYLKEAPNSSRE